MKEFGPVNQDRLTYQPDNPKLERRGDIFMPEGGEGFKPPIVSAEKPTVIANISLPTKQETPADEASKQSPIISQERKIELARKIWTNRYGGDLSMLQFDERQAVESAIAAGVLPEMAGAARIIDVDGISDSKILNEIDISDVLTQASGGAIDIKLIRETIEKVMRLEGVPKSEKDLVTERLSELQRQTIADMRAQMGNESESGGSLRMYLEPKEIKMLETDAMKWLEDRFDMIYGVAAQGQELNSPIVQTLQQHFSLASSFLSVNREKFNISPEAIEEFNNYFMDRLNLIFLRSAIDHRSIQSAKEMSARLQASGLFRAFAMENGNVYRMFGRMGELLEDKRLSQEKLIIELAQEGHTADQRKDLLEKAKKFHVTPEMVSNLQQNLINEQLELAKKGIGDYGKAYEKAIGESKSSVKVDAFVEAKIRRAVRAGYDTLVVTQRAAIIVARGHSLPDADRFMSDPTGLFNVYNYEDLLTGKFRIYNQTDKEFLNEMKLFIAKSKLGKDRYSQLSDVQRLDYGTRMLRDLSAVPDFFSSGWRADGILKSFEQRLEVEGYSDVKGDFGLFLRLFRSTKDAHTDPEKREARQQAWKKIAEIRPEEIARLYRERADGNEILTAQLNKFFEGDVFNGVREYKIDENGQLTRETDAFRTYDKFKKEFGPLVQLLRQEGYRKFQALRLGEVNFGLSREEAEEFNKIIVRYFSGEDKKELVDKFGGDVSKMPDEIRKMFAQMSKVISEKNPDPRIKDDVISQLTDNDKFEDTYTRVLLVDDAFLNLLEKPPEGKSITPISQFWTSEVAADALVRNFNDTEHAMKAHGAFLNFVKSTDGAEKAKQAIEFAEETSQYNGQEARAECVKFTIGSFLGMSKQKFIWDVLGVSKLPFRKPSSRIEEIYGYAANPLNMDTRRVELDKIRTYLINAGDSNASKALKELEDYISVTGKDMAKRRAASFLIYMLLAVLVEGGQLAKNVTKEK